MFKPIELPQFLPDIKLAAQNAELAKTISELNKVKTELSQGFSDLQLHNAKLQTRNKNLGYALGITVFVIVVMIVVWPKENEEEKLKSRYPDARS